MGWLNLVSLAGFAGFGLLAWAAGGFQRPIPWRTVLGSSVLVVLIGAVVFWVPPTRAALLALNDAVLAVLSAGTAGARFLFGPLAVGPGEVSPTGEKSVGFVLAAQVLPAVIFFAALMGLLYHLGIVQPVVRLFARLFHRSLGLSGAESLAGAANIFVGVESALTVRPYLDRMTRSELLTLLTCGMSTVASTTLAIYVGLLKNVFPQIAGHLISASVLSIPCAALVSKLLLPERESPETLGRVPRIVAEEREAGPMAALAAGSWDGLKLSAGIATLLIAVLGLVALFDVALGRLSAPFREALGGPLDSSRLLGWLFAPLAVLLGLDLSEVPRAAELLGQRAILTEVVAYQKLASLAASGAISDRGLLVLSYALCGFAHVASTGIFVGGTAALAPRRRADLAAVGLKALTGSTLATLMTGALAGAFYYGQRGVLGL